MLKVLPTTSFPIENEFVKSSPPESEHFLVRGIILKRLILIL